MNKVMQITTEIGLTHVTLPSRKSFTVNVQDMYHSNFKGEEFIFVRLL